MKNEVLASILIVMLFSSLSFAEAIYLKNGRTINGQILERTDKSVKVNVKGITLTYDMEDIERIGNATLSPPALIPPAAPTLMPNKAIENVNASSLPKTVDIVSANPNFDALNLMNKNDLIVNLIEATGAKENMNQMFAQILSQAKPEEVEKLRIVLSVDEVIKQIIPVYGKYFTEEELKELLTFYKSQTGRKYLTLMPQIIQDSMKASMAYFQSKMEPTQQSPPANPPPAPGSDIPEGY